MNGRTHSLWIFENRVARKILGPKRQEVRGAEENSITKRFMICALHQILEGSSGGG
jgi:hypothetical protein